MLKVVLLVCFLAAGVFSESVRETETWVPKKVEMDDIDLESSGDFGFPTEDPATIDYEDDDDDDDDNYEESGSGDLEEYEGFTEDGQFEEDTTELDNKIPEEEPPRTPTTFNDNDLVAENEVYRSSSVLQNKAEHNIFHKTEVLAAVIAGGAVGLLFAVLLILLLVYRMKKKDEGSYDLGKKPIYKKAPTAEIYA